MKRRYKESRKTRRRTFSKTADTTHKFNIKAAPMRGGIRMQAMPCYHPLTGWKSLKQNSSGKRSIVFKAELGLPESQLQVPCGKCIGCRLERSRQWAMRCVHEASLYSENCFITLTYSPENLPENMSLDKTHFQKFMKRLRKKFKNDKIRYFQCGEYGEEQDEHLAEYSTIGRPHYHACLFNFNFPDLVLYSVRDGVRLYTSEILNKIWGYGYCTIGDVTFESAAYVARYVTKKINGPKAKEHYKKLNPDTGEIHDILPEYVTMSRGGKTGRGIAHAWYQEFKNDLRKDFITLRGVKMMPAKYYDKLLEEEEPERYEHIKAVRQERAEMLEADNTPERLQVREAIKQRKIKQLLRNKI